MPPPPAKHPASWTCPRPASLHTPPDVHHSSPATTARGATCAALKPHKKPARPSSWKHAWGQPTPSPAPSRPPPNPCNMLTPAPPAALHRLLPPLPQEDALPRSATWLPVQCLAGVPLSFCCAFPCLAYPRTQLPAASVWACASTAWVKPPVGRPCGHVALRSAFQVPDSSLAVGRRNVSCGAQRVFALAPPRRVISQPAWGRAGCRGVRTEAPAEEARGGAHASRRERLWGFARRRTEVVHVTLVCECCSALGGARRPPPRTSLVSHRAQNTSGRRRGWRRCARCCCCWRCLGPEGEGFEHVSKWWKRQAFCRACWQVWGREGRSPEEEEEEEVVARGSAPWHLVKLHSFQTVLWWPCAPVLISRPLGTARGAACLPWMRTRRMGRGICLPTSAAPRESGSGSPFAAMPLRTALLGLGLT